MMFGKRTSSRRSDDAMDDDSDDKDYKRKSRNLSEKKRRDQFNLLVNELSSMVSTRGRKMDKSTVLKATISFLKNHNEIAARSRVHEIHEDWKPTFLTNEEFTHLILEAVDGFITVFSSSGQFFYISESITSLLGHLATDILGMTIYDLASEEDHGELYNVLLGPSEDERPLSFSCHLKRDSGDVKLPPVYELVHFEGYFRSDNDGMHSDNSRYSGFSGEADTRLLFVGTGRLQTPQLIRELPLVDSSNSEFSSRFSLEWKFLFLDHRAPPIIGYLPFELLGTCGYDYYHVDDIDKVINCHDALMKKGEGTSCFYRFLTKGQQWIWLQSRFYITYHQWNSKPEFIVCTHRVVSYVDVLKKGVFDDNSGIFEESTSEEIGNSVPCRSRRTRVAHDPSSDCTSMSADSPTSRHSGMTHFSRNSRASVGQQAKNVPTQSNQPPSAPHFFIEPTQYVAAIPIQPVIASFAAPLQPIDNIGLISMPSQIQVDLQRKHAELQAIIGQQQAELRKVSEQLLMARLGLMQSAQNDHVPFVSSSSYNSGTVSSTTTLSGISPSLSSSVIVPSVSLPLTIPISQHQNNVVFSNPNENKML